MPLKFTRPHFDDHAEIAHAFAAIRPYGGARLLMADPPWHFEDWSDRGDKSRSVTSKYQTQSLPWIMALPVDALVGDNCILWLWATNPMIRQALDCMEAWGFEFSTMGHWNKRTTHGKLAFGGGRRLRSASEPFIIATRGRPPVLTRSVRSVIEEPEDVVIDAARREHSRKPDAAYTAAEAMAPDAPRVELFARETRPGWICWGNQIDRFEVA